VALLVFDLDGTLVDSRQDLANSVNAMLAELDRPALPSAVVAEMVGEGAGVLVKRALAARGVDPARTSGALQRFLVLYEERLLDYTREYEGITAALQTLQCGNRLAVLTNKPGHASRRILEGLGLARFFADVVGGDSAHPRKPDPAALLHLASRFGAGSEDRWMIGDSRIDLETARNAGARACLVRYGFGFRFEESDLAGAVVADTPADIPRLVTAASRA
jgi:phosphoglycolate phosphatase